jgi:hypothetical protein
MNITKRLGTAAALAVHMATASHSGSALAQTAERAEKVATTAIPRPTGWVLGKETPKLPDTRISHAEAETDKICLNAGAYNGKPPMTNEEKAGFISRHVTLFANRFAPGEKNPHTVISKTFAAINERIVNGQKVKSRDKVCFSREEVIAAKAQDKAVTDAQAAVKKAEIEKVLAEAKENEPLTTVHDAIKLGAEATIARRELSAKEKAKISQVVSEPVKTAENHFGWLMTRKQAEEAAAQHSKEASKVATPGEEDSKARKVLVDRSTSLLNSKGVKGLDPNLAYGCEEEYTMGKGVTGVSYNVKSKDGSKVSDEAKQRFVDLFNHDGCVLLEARIEQQIKNERAAQAAAKKAEQVAKQEEAKASKKAEKADSSAQVKSAKTATSVAKPTVEDDSVPINPEIKVSCIKGYDIGQRDSNNPQAGRPVFKLRGFFTEAPLTATQEERNQAIAAAKAKDPKGETCVSVENIKEEIEKHKAEMVKD